ncbi:aspartate-tRNA ligase [Purpureocillium lavendulum]|uniref:Aspartate-tRNA ligase n=1 Tax=Purpureocillium lavendulum TaxID=1247861 RepID=A0AB34FD85_9HYPO|nr:aspartate-tRNA ligase [Purpureocillium lavendulum]
MALSLLVALGLLAGSQLRVHASPVPDGPVGDTGITADQMKNAFPSRDPFNSSNWWGTSLYGYDKCAEFSSHIKSWINEAYTDANRIVNLEGVKDNIDWNSAASLEYLGPPALNKNQQKQIQAVFANVATVSPGIAPFPNWIREDEGEGEVIAYARNPDSAAGRKWPDISFCPIWYGMRNLDNAIAYGSGFSNPKSNQDISNYVSRASAFLHELFHLDLAADSKNDSPNPKIRDIKIRYTKKDGQRSRWVTAYGAKHAKILARFLPISPSSKQTGYFVQRNDDNFVYFALANYIKSKTKWYPFLPVVAEHDIAIPMLPGPRSIQPIVTYQDNGEQPANLIQFSPETVGNTSQISGASDCPVADVQAGDPNTFDMGKAIPSSSYPDSYWKERDGWIKSLGDNNDNGGTCKMTIKEVWTCESIDSNLYAEVLIKNPKGKTLYATPGSAHSPGQPINDKSPLKLTVPGMQETLIIVGEHTNDYMQFYYGNKAWRSGDRKGDARCSLKGQDWGKGPTGCPNAMAASRTFECQWPC